MAFAAGVTLCRQKNSTANPK
uniref:Uncharacterized protein n=1 Tax=Rhizophora mucronata TaxID=61149 RepID=A0A2P2NC13_RHIMU